MCWPDGAHFANCRILNVPRNIRHRSVIHRHRDFPKKPQFTARVGTIMHRSHLTHWKWAVGLYPHTFNIKGVS